MYNESIIKQPFKKNKRDNSLAIFGKRFTNLLRILDFDHTQKSIVESQYI